MLSKLHRTAWIRRTRRSSTCKKDLGKELTAEDEVINALATMSLGRKQKLQKYVKNDLKDNQSTQKNSDVECYYCKNKGHFASQCRKKQRDKKNQNNGSQDINKYGGNCMFVVTSRNEVEDPSESETKKLMNMDMKDSWITDSGASRHIVESGLVSFTLTVENQYR